MSFVIHILENVAAQVALPALSYVCEVADDGVVLAGVELELPTHGDFLPADRRFFWAAAGTFSWCILLLVPRLGAPFALLPS